MTHLGSTAEWVDLLDSQVPQILALVIETWEKLPPPAANEREDPVTNRLCSALQRCPNRADYPFRIQPQAVILEPDSGDELGRLDIAFLPFVTSDEVYFCLECKRINVRTANGIRPYFVEYVRFGMLRFVSGQYARAVRHGGMLAFVLNGDIPAAIAGIEDNVKALHQGLGMDAPGEFQTSRIRQADPRVRETHHRRRHSSDTFVIHHLFMAGDPHADMLPEPAETTAGPGRNPRQKTSRWRKRK
jgi:hypothetical protein